MYSGFFFWFEGCRKCGKWTLGFDDSIVFWNCSSERVNGRDAKGLSVAGLELWKDACARNPSNCDFSHCWAPIFRNAMVMSDEYISIHIYSYGICFRFRNREMNLGF